MKGIIKIITRYLLSAATIAISLLIINFVILATWTVSSAKYSIQKYDVSEISEGLKKTGDNFILSKEASSMISSQSQWAMLIDDNGKVVWSINLPEDVPLSYSFSDIASFTRWYLNDYPVRVWKHENGLFVLGNSKNSSWKLQLEFPEIIVRNMQGWLLGGLIINFTAALLLAFLLGIRFFLSLKRVVNGIEDMAQKRLVSLHTRGTLGNLAYKINSTSRELLRQQNLIEKRDAARNNWITAVSHDIRTPLSMIMGYSSSLEDNEKLSEEDRKQISIIRSQSEKIKQLINDLNLTVKLEYEMQPLNKEEFYVSELMRKIVVDYLNNFCNDKYNLELFISDEAQGYKLNGDIHLFERAINNIISNSIKHNEEGCDIFIDISKKENLCLIEIKDTGIGFENDTLEKLNFSDEFPTGASHGLGLFIVKKIISVHEGKIVFANSEKGSSIKIYLP